MPEYRDLNDFLCKHITKDKTNITHTRIPGNENDNIIYPGKYHIPEEERYLFLKLYHRDVFINKKHEYLTEKQLKNGKSQILVDMDFRYEPSIKARQHSEEHIEDLLILYIEKIAMLMDIEPNVKIPVYVFEKPTINTKDKTITKDGIHIIIGIQMDHDLQCVLRNEVLQDKTLTDILEDLPLTNDYESVLDDGISKGHTNWQMYGSRKPNHDAYELSKFVEFEIDEDGEIHALDKDIHDVDHLHLLNRASAHYQQSVIFGKSKLGTEKLNAYLIANQRSSACNGGNQIIGGIGGIGLGAGAGGDNQQQGKNRMIKKELNFTHETFSFDIGEIRNIEILQQLVDSLMSSIPVDKYHLKETHQYLMSLPSKYYDDYPLWIRCGWALHNTDFRLFISWMYFSSQSNKFNFSDIPKYYDTWCTMKDEGYTERSIMYWAKESNLTEFKKIREETVDFYIKQTEDSPTEWDVANVLYQIYKDEYKCANMKNKVWYQFKHHRWVEIDSGSTLRYNISKTLSRIYGVKADEFLHQSGMIGEQNPELSERYRKIASKYGEVSSQLKRTAYKQNIMKEASEIFSVNDPDFVSRLDMNRNLLCFTNGVFDFEAKCFRDGKPEDYLSLCTNIPYKKINKNNAEHIQIMSEIKDFMEKLFPDSELNRYMWEHLASTLIGTNKNQTFNIYNGSGSNGKSKLVELMSMILGEYKGVVPITLVTQKRNNIGSLSPEIAALKGIRYAVMNEPSKGDRLNDGIMKELTGEDPITGRALFKEPVTFVPQFKLVVCTNNLFDITSNDDGTWRRIRLCEFMSKFVKEPRDDDETQPYQFKLDPEITIKFEKWKHLFMSMLVDIAVEKEGIVKDCALVLSASNEYRKKQDYLLEFVQEKIEKSDEPHARIRTTEAYSEFKTWYQETYGKNVPKGKELYEFMDKRFGKRRNNCWTGCKINYDNDDMMINTAGINDEY
jgi:P4 family phage/plasmid primase-like protien